MVLCVMCVLGRPWQSAAYSVLTHEAIIDVCWDSSIRPLLLKKYPGTTEEQLRGARAYAYGGAVSPDMGYYPFGSKLFTNLVHYVRSGDFVNALLDEAQNVNEYAFALGGLCHYNADKYGHPIGTNRCVGMVYPEDKEKYGDVITYEQHPVSHVRTEFGFDILQTARGNYASEAYHDFIGFRVSRPVLERAFLKTYGLDISDVFKDFSLATETFRWIIKELFPVLTRAAWASRKKDIIKARPGITRRKFEYRMRKASYYHEFGRKHERPGFFPGVLAKVVYVLPKVGPLRTLKLKVPGPDAEVIFIQSFDTVVVHYATALKTLRYTRLTLQNIDFDTGKPTGAGEYSLADDTYIELLLKLDAGNFSRTDEGLLRNVARFYDGCNEQMASRAGSEKWQQVTVALDSLKKIKH